MILRPPIHSTPRRASSAGSATRKDAEWVASSFSSPHPESGINTGQDWTDAPPTQAHQFMTILTTPPKPGTLVSIERWEKREAPQRRTDQPATVLSVETGRRCESGFMVTILTSDHRRLELDLHWLAEVKP